MTATVTDRSGRFYSQLRKEDFLVYEDNKPVEVTHFSAERTPVSLGIVVDSSGSMAGEKWSAAVNSIDRFFRLMNDELDEFFLYRFSANADLVADWTNDRDRLATSLGRIHPNGGTAMYDAAAEAVPMAQGGQNRKKAIVIISDGNDTSSRVGVSGGEAARARDRSARVRGRHRRPGRNRRSSARRRRCSSRRACRFRFPFPAAADAAAAAASRWPGSGGYPPSGGRRQWRHLFGRRRRSRQRDGACAK